MEIRAIFSEDGFPQSFYSLDIHGDEIPAKAVSISQPQWLEFISNPGRRQWRDGEVVVVDHPEIVPTITDYENAIQNLVDETAREKQFRDGVTLASYIGSSKPKWAAEAQAFVAWRDYVWTSAYAELEKVQNGEREQPSIEAIIEELPKITWPST